MVGLPDSTPHHANVRLHYQTRKAEWPLYLQVRPCYQEGLQGAFSDARMPFFWTITHIVLQLSPSDLDSILPISDMSNPHGGPNHVRIYNLCDVVALSLELNLPASSPKSSPLSSGSQSGSTALAMPKGPKILRTNAMREYKVYFTPSVL